MEECCFVAHLCTTVCDPMVCSLPASSVQGTSQAEMLECPTQGSNQRLLGLLHCQADSLPLVPLGSPKLEKSAVYPGWSSWKTS